MKNIKWIISGILALLLLVVYGSYNGLIQTSQEVDNQWSQVQTQYQRRNDLIPNLVNTVKAEANFEKSTLTDVINARAKATAINVNANTMNDAKQFAQYQSAQAGVSSTLSRLMMVSENYPNLKTNQQFSQLMFEISGTENRIAVARKDYNDSVKAYNIKIKTLPTVLFASMLGFTKKQYFAAEDNASVAPKVDFN